MRRGLVMMAVLATVAFLECRTAPTTVLLRIEAEVGLPQPEELRLDVFGAGGGEVKDRRLPETGRPALPGEVVLYPRQAGQLRLHVRALAFGKPVGDGAVSVEARAGEQQRATVVLRASALTDRDGDGVPDVIDNCPDVPNPEQRPCQPDGQVVDGRPDGGVDTLPDLLPPDLIDCDKDRDGYRALGCGGNDCDDANPSVNPGRSEGPPGDSSCADTLDNDCDNAKDLADTNCHTCTSPAECDDNNVCTADSCTDGVCKNVAANDGLVCDDGNACTTNTVCKSGLCSGGQPLNCSTADSCKPASCDPSNGCTTQIAPNGTKCSDGKFCTEGETCTAGACGGGAPKDCTSGAPACKVGTCNEAAASCVYTAVSGSLACDDGDACTQGEKCASGVCTPPAMVLETVDAGGMNAGTDRATRVDSAGAVHVAYHTGSGALRHATNAGGAWTSEPVDTGSPDVGEYPALAIDGLGQLHVAYFDAAKNQVRHAVKGSNGWQTETVESGMSVYGYTSLAVDSAGVHVSYKRDVELRYGVKTLAGWNKTTVDSATTEAVGFNTSLAVDASGKVHIAHTRGNFASASGVDYVILKALRYTTNSSGTWVTTEPASLASEHGGTPSLALGSTGQIYITHSTNTLFLTAGGTLYLTSRVAGQWKTETLKTPAEEGTFSSIVLNSGGKVYIAYRRPAATLAGAELRYATNVSGSWVTKPVEIIGGTNGFASMAQAPNGTMHVVYKNASAAQSTVRHAAFSACP